ncbi:MAG: YfjI family protein [Pseudobdellovibrio sp.]|nr:YfjI family protein [Pseudobdellovibrio sp.]
MTIDFTNIETGNVGEFVEILHPLVESNKESILIQLLTCFGNCIGRSAHFRAAEDKHFANLFVAVVGKSSRGRKGQSLNLIKSLFEEADSEWFNERVKKGLSSGEGLIAHISDHTLVDGGTSLVSETKDKRLLCVESEFSSVLKVAHREGNILSQILRDSWDSVTLQTLTKNNPIKATNPMVSIIGHITDAELIKFLSSTEIANGLANRFIFIRAASDKRLANPEPIPEEVKTYLSNLLKIAIGKARERGVMRFSHDGLIFWEGFYESLSNDDPTIVGSLTARQEAQVRRLAMIIALMNGKDLIDAESLIFAVKIFDYSIETLREIYGHSFGDPLTDKMFDLLKSSPDGSSRSEISNFFGRNYQKGNLDRSLELLKSQGLIKCIKSQNPAGGRPTEHWIHSDFITKETN